MNNSLISKLSFPQCLFFSKIIYLLKPYLLIRGYKTWKRNIYKNPPFFFENLKNSTPLPPPPPHTHNPFIKVGWGQGVPTIKTVLCVEDVEKGTLCLIPNSTYLVHIDDRSTRMKRKKQRVKKQINIEKMIVKTCRMFASLEMMWVDYQSIKHGAT